VIKNPSFEGINFPGEWTRKTHTGREYGEIYVPAGWVAWWEENVYRCPEMKVIPKQAPFLDPPRIADGEWAFQSFTYYGRQHAGLYQIIEGLVPGRLYKFTAHAHAWSTTPPLTGHNDARCSAGVGCGPVYIPEGEAPPLNGDPENDAIGNFLFQVGVGFGNPNPFEGVTWGSGAHIYNGYFQVPPVTFVAPSDGKAVVYLRAISLWEFRNSDAYWDDVVLETIDVEPPPPPQKCIPPRIQYARTYVLLPQITDPYKAMEWRTAAAIATADGLRTIGHSADDAGVGPLDRTIVAINPASWTGDADDLKTFYNKYYAGAEYKSIDAGTPWEMAIKLLPKLGNEDIALGQTDPRWAGYDFGEQPGGGTIGGYGCLLTGLSIILRKIYQRRVTPPVLDKILCAARAPFANDNRLIWKSSISLFPAFDDYIKNNQHRSADRLRELLDTGWEIILRRADGKHFVYLERIDGKALHIIDTWDGKRRIKTADDYVGIRAAHIKSIKPSSTQSLISLHLQSMVDGVLEFVAAAKPNVIKVFQMENARAIKDASPETQVVLRYFTDNQDLGNPDKVAAARAYIATFRDSLEINAEWIDYVESWNETVCSGNPASIRNAVAFDVAFADALAETGLPVAPALLTVAVGNPLESEVELLLPAVEKAVQYNGLVSYHAYWPDAPERCYLESDWQWYAGRWTEWDKVFNAHGLYPRYYFGEMGAVGAAEGLTLLPNEGWRSPDCCDGDWDRYLAELMAFSSLVAEWNTIHDNRALGGVIFTTGGWGWESFEIGKSEMEDLATWQKPEEV